MKRQPCAPCRRLKPGPMPMVGSMAWARAVQLDIEPERAAWVHPLCFLRLLALAMALHLRPCRECDALTDASDRLCLPCWGGDR